MAEKNNGNGGTEQAAKADPINVRMTLVPQGHTAAPTLINYTAVQPGRGAVIIEGGYLDEQMIRALGRAAKAGKVPESISAPLAARLALTPDAAMNLYRQLGQMFAQAKKAQDKKGA
jgi:hypothetical protein